MKKFRVSNSALTLAISMTVFCGNAQSLEVGFEGLLSYEIRQSTDAINFANEEIPDTKFGTGKIGFFGEQKSRWINAGFSGNIETERNLTAEDVNYNTDSRFIGAMDIAITPRTLRWHFGDVLAGVRNADAVRIADDINQNTTNVFVTGVSYESEVEGVNSTTMRLFYAHQSEDTEEVQSLYSFGASHQKSLSVNSSYGIRFNDIYTDVAVISDQDSTVEVLDDANFNRMSAALFTERTLAFGDFYAEIGATRYTTDSDTTEGLTAALRMTRRVGPRSNLSAGLTHSLNDQTLNTIETLLRGEADDAGLQPEINGIFAETRLNIGYEVELPSSELSIQLSTAQLDYQLLTGDSAQNIDVDSEDQNQSTLSLTYSKAFTSRFEAAFTTSYELEEYKNKIDNTDAIMVSANLGYALSRSFALDLSIIYDAAEGVDTRGTVLDPTQIMIDETVTRGILSLRWTPPTRATNELTVGINSLVQ